MRAVTAKSGALKSLNCGGVCPIPEFFAKSAQASLRAFRIWQRIEAMNSPNPAGRFGRYDTAAVPR